MRAERMWNYGRTKCLLPDPTICSKIWKCDNLVTINAKCRADRDKAGDTCFAMCVVQNSIQELEILNPQNITIFLRAKQASKLVIRHWFTACTCKCSEGDIVAVLFFNKGFWLHCIIRSSDASFVHPLKIILKLSRKCFTAITDKHLTRL